MENLWCSGFETWLQATVSTWKLGWEFTDGEVLRQQQDIFTSGVDAISLSNSTVQIQSYVNNTVLPFNWTGISFLAYRASTTGSNNTYGVSNHSSCHPFTSIVYRFVMQNSCSRHQGSFVVASVVRICLFSRLRQSKLFQGLCLGTYFNSYWYPPEQYTSLLEN